MRRKAAVLKEMDCAPPHLSELNEAARRRTPIRGDLGIEGRSELMISFERVVGGNYTLAGLI